MIKHKCFALKFESKHSCIIEMTQVTKTMCAFPPPPFFGCSLSYIYMSVEAIVHHSDMDGLTYGTAKKKRPGYLVGNLVATNWPIEKDN